MTILPLLPMRRPPDGCCSLPRPRAAARSSVCTLLLAPLPARRRPPLTPTPRLDGAGQQLQAGLQLHAAAAAVDNVQRALMGAAAASCAEG